MKFGVISMSFPFRSSAILPKLCCRHPTSKVPRRSLFAFSLCILGMQWATFLLAGVAITLGIALADACQGGGLFLLQQWANVQPNLCHTLGGTGAATSCAYTIPTETWGLSRPTEIQVNWLRVLKGFQKECTGPLGNTIFTRLGATLEEDTANSLDKYLEQFDGSVGNQPTLRPPTKVMRLRLCVPCRAQSSMDHLIRNLY